MFQTDSAVFAKKIRHHAVRMVYLAKASHIGTCLSMADLIAMLYTQILNLKSSDPHWTDRDRFILSKGHGCAILYAALAECGFFSIERLETYGQDHSDLMTHISHKVPGVEFSTGSLGHGLPFACGKALAAKRQNKKWRVFAMLSDGELDEGSNWESILFAPHHHLDNLVAIIDYNKIQSLGSVEEILDLKPLKEKFQAFNWSTREIDGHNHQEIKEALSQVPWETGKPSCLIAHTVKGKGINFMENQLLWHYKSPDQNQLAEAIKQIEDCP